MDLASGIWSKKLVERGVSAGIAFDADSQLVFLSSASERAIYSVNAGLASSSQWASIFERAQSISSLAVDSARKRLLVGEAFSGVVYSLALDTRRQSTLVEGLGTVNSTVCAIFSISPTGGDAPSGSCRSPGRGPESRESSTVRVSSIRSVESPPTGNPTFGLRYMTRQT